MNTPSPSLRTILVNGLWHQNTGLVVLLGLCPLLAVSTSVINGLGLGLATTFTLVLTNLSVSLLRGLLRPEIRIPCYVLIIASVVTAIELLMQAWLHELYLLLGIFIPLIVTNCAVIGRAEAFASRNPPLAAAVDGFATGAGFTAVLVLLGGLRELLGRGSLLSGAELLFGEGAAGLVIQVLPGGGGFLLALLPAGAFITLGLLVAARNAWQQRMTRPAVARPEFATEPVPEASAR